MEEQYSAVLELKPANRITVAHLRIYGFIHLLYDLLLTGIFFLPLACISLDLFIGMSAWAIFFLLLTIFSLCPAITSIKALGVTKTGSVNRSDWEMLSFILSVRFVYSPVVMLLGCIFIIFWKEEIENKRKGDLNWLYFPNFWLGAGVTFVSTGIASIVSTWRVYSSLEKAIKG